jgi:hypothetical protein
MIRKLNFASCYVYSPGGAGRASERSRLLCTLLKSADMHFMERYASRVREEMATNESLAEHLDASPVWVPVPGNAPAAPGARPVSEHLALALLRAGVGGNLWTGLCRRRAVRKSATSCPGKRPTVAAHFDSFEVERDLPPPARVVLLDDVITKGRTLMAAAMRLNDAFPDIEIRAFAMLRTMGRVDHVEQLVDPCIGVIRWRAGDAHREP